VACTAAVAALPLTRVGEGGRSAALLTALTALVVLVAGLVSGWARLVPASLLLVGGLYAIELVADDASLDTAAPAVAGGLLVAAELAYWSLDEREHVRGERGAALAQLAFVAALGVAAGVVAATLLVVADAVRAHGLGVDVAGAAAAALALLLVVLVARGAAGEE
jgi:hypothetical protein